MSTLELLPIHVTPGALAESCHSWSFCRRISKSQRRIAFAQSCHFLNSCPVTSLLELLPCRVTPGAPAGESLYSSGALLSPSRVTPGALAQSCQSWSSCRQLSNFQRPIVFARRVTPGALAQSCQSWSSCPVVALLELLPANF